MFGGITWMHHMFAAAPYIFGVGVIVLYIAQHISGGGYLHPRYLFPVLGSIAVLLVIGLDRVWPRILPVVVLASMAIWTLSQIPIGIDPSLKPLDALLASFVRQRRMKLSGEYKPCYRIVA